MREPREPRSIIDAAEKAAAAGDFASAEQLLREAALLQEERFGAVHPDLANTFNNLGIVCEITGNPTDAERYFQRACTIATMVLPADHPFVVTSRKNLQDFCEARGKPAELPTLPDSVAVAEETPATAGVKPPPEPPAAVQVKPARESSWPAAPQGVEAPARPRSVRPLVIGAIGLAALLIVVLAATRPWGSTDGAAPSPAVAIDPPRESPAPDVERPRVVSAPPRAPIEPIRAHCDRVGPSQRARCERQRDHAGIDKSRAADGGESAAMRHARRLALQAVGRSGWSRPAVFLHAGQVSSRHDSPASVVSREPAATVRPAPHSGQSNRRLPHVQPPDNAERPRRQLASRAQGRGRRAAARGAFLRSLSGSCLTGAELRSPGGILRRRRAHRAAADRTRRARCRARSFAGRVR